MTESVDRSAVPAPLGVEPGVSTTAFYCRHENIASSCEECALVRAVERGERVVTPEEARAAATPAAGEPVDHDLYVDLPNTDPPSAVFVAKGDPIPRDVAGLPTRPARIVPDRSRRKR